jgi:hypothetical protein
MTDTRERYVVTRAMAAPPEEIFAILAALERSVH